MKKRINLKEWAYDGDVVRLDYEDGDTAYVRKTDFDRAFGAIINASKEEVVRDFAVAIARDFKANA